MAQPSRRSGVRHRGQPLPSSHGGLPRGNDDRRGARAPARGRHRAAAARRRQLRRVSAGATARALPRSRVLSARSLSLRGMKIYLATASTDDVAWGAAHGMLDGVLTSPGLLADDADAEMRTHLAELCRLVHGPIFASVHSVDGANAYRDGKELAKI